MLFDIGETSGGQLFRRERGLVEVGGWGQREHRKAIRSQTAMLSKTSDNAFINLGINLSV